VFKEWGKDRGARLKEYAKGGETVSTRRNSREKKKHFNPCEREGESSFKPRTGLTSTQREQSKKDAGREEGLDEKGARRKKGRV